MTLSAASAFLFFFFPALTFGLVFAFGLTITVCHRSCIPRLLHVHSSLLRKLFCPSPCIELGRPPSPHCCLCASPRPLPAPLPFAPLVGVV